MALDRLTTYEYPSRRMMTRAASRPQGGNVVEADSGENMTSRRSTRRPLTLSRYVARRNEVELGARGSLVKMLHRSLGAGSFAEFWLYWNPIWGYHLGRYINRPLRHFIPAAPALALTFIVSGAVHDAAIITVSGSITFLFVPWFAILSLVVVLSSWAGVDYAARRWTLRAAINVATVGASLGLAVLGKPLLGIP